MPYSDCSNTPGECDSLFPGIVKGVDHKTQSESQINQNLLSIIIKSLNATGWGNKRRCSWQVVIRIICLYTRGIQYTLIVMIIVILFIVIILHPSF